MNDERDQRRPRAILARVPSPLPILSLSGSKARLWGLSPSAGAGYKCSKGIPGRAFRRGDITKERGRAGVGPDRAFRDGVPDKKSLGRGLIALGYERLG